MENQYARNPGTHGRSSRISQLEPWASYIGGGHSRLLDPIQKGEIDPSFIISHRVAPDEVPEMYNTWLQKQDHGTKIVIDPWADRIAA